MAVANQIAEVICSESEPETLRGVTTFTSHS